MTSDLTLHLQGYERAAPGASDVIAERVLQSLFLAVNLSRGGAFSSALPVAAPEDGVTGLMLAGEVLEGAWNRARDDGWPHLQPLSFSRTWEWLAEARFHECGVAASPLQKALCAVLEVAVATTHDTTRILIVAQALEALMTESEAGPPGAMRRRMEVILGKPAARRNWFNKFYTLRSRIAHGSEPWIRPARHLDEGDESLSKHLEGQWRPSDRAVALLFALLHDLIAHDAEGYEVLEEVLRRP